MSCEHCGENSIVTDHKEGDEVCSNCGAVVHCFEMYNENENHYNMPLPYLKHKYVLNTIIPSILSRGGIIEHYEIESIVQMFKTVVRSFEETRHIHKRRSMLWVPFIVGELCKLRGFDMSDFIKLPKLRSTRDKMKQDWDIINPFKSMVPRHERVKVDFIKLRPSRFENRKKEEESRTNYRWNVFYEKQENETYLNTFGDLENYDD